MANYAPQNIVTILQGLQKENDRSTAIVGASLIEHALEESIKSVFRTFDNNDLDRMFGPQGVLTGLSSKILMAYALSIIGPTTRRDFDLIRRIRNEFAHDMNPIKFTDSQISNRYREIARKDHTSIADAKSIRGRFLRLIGVYTSALLFQSQAGLEAIKKLKKENEEHPFQIAPDEDDALEFAVLVLD